MGGNLYNWGKKIKRYSYFSFESALSGLFTEHEMGADYGGHSQ